MSSSDPPPTPQMINVDQPFDADGLYTLRATLAAHASELGAGEEQIGHLLVVASELANNAIRHGGGRGRLRLWHHDGVLYCQVTDYGPGLPDPTVSSAPPDPTSGHGRGIWICRNLTTELTIEAGPDGRGTTVTAAVPGPPLEASPSVPQ